MSKVRLSEQERARRRAADREQSVAAVRALASSDGWQSWLATRRHFYRYSLSNQLLIALQCPQASRVAGFRAWLKLGYCVRKGERAIRIWVPMAPSKARMQAWRAAGADPGERPATFFRLGPVFDRSQVDALPAPAIPASLDCPIGQIGGDELSWALAPLIALDASIGSSVAFEGMAVGRGGSYDTATKAIAINDTHSLNAQVKTLIHELAHALLRVEPNSDDPALSYAEEELVVESVAYTVCGSAGLDVSAYAIPYLASWSEQASLETVTGCAGMIDRYARRLENVLQQSLSGEVALAA
jgi:antirestriction protein ArdC